jgi:flagellar biogenesis protein FliO
MAALGSASLRSCRFTFSLALVLAGPALAGPTGPVTVTQRADADALWVQVHTGSAQPVTARVSVSGTLLLLEVSGVVPKRRWLEISDPLVHRTLIHPPRNGARATQLRLRLKRPLTAAQVAGVRVSVLGSLVELGVPRTSAVALAWSKGQSTAVAVERPRPSAPVRIRAVPIEGFAEPVTQPPSKASASTPPVVPVVVASAGVNPQRSGRSPSALWAVLAALGLVLVVGYLVWRRRGQPTASALGVLGQITMGAGQGVVLIEVEGAQVLLGVDESGTRVLAQWPLEGAPVAGAERLTESLVETLQRLGGA